MGAEALIFLSWLGMWLKTIFLFMITVGTNEGLVAFFLKNILLLMVIVKITPGQWDDKMLSWLQEKITNFRNKGEGRNLPAITPPEIKGEKDE